MGLAAGLVLCELLLRAGGIGFPLPYAPDEYCGTRLMPGFSGWWRKEGRAYIQTNRFGFRHGDRGPDKPPGSFRVAVLGDSFIEAFQVADDQTLCHVVEQKLARCEGLDGRNVEVLNFGVSGYGTAQQLQMLRHYAGDYSPDVVVLAFFPGNDLRNNSPELEPYHVRPFYRLRDGRLELDDSFRQHPDFLKARSATVRWKVWLINHWRMLQLINEIRSRRAPARGNGQTLLGAGIDATAWTEPSDRRWQEAWQVTERLIVEVYQEVERRGARFLLLVIGSDVDVHPDTALCQRTLRELAVDDLRYPERRLQELGRQRGFRVLELAEPMSWYARAHQQTLHGFDNSRSGFGHWNATGNQVAGEWTAKAICELFGPSADHDWKAPRPEDGHCE